MKKYWPLQHGRPARGIALGKRWQELAQETDGSSLRAFARRYLEHLEVRHYAQCTLVTHCQDLARFAQWAAEREIRTPAEVTRPILERYQRHLFYYRKADGKPLTAGNQGHHILCLRGFFRWLAKGNYIPSNPASELELPRQPLRQLREALTVEEVERLLALLDIAHPVELRDRAFFELLYSTGVRRFEALGLTIYDVDASQGTVFVRQGKGRKDRFVPIGERALAWLEKYRDEVRSQWAVDPMQQHMFLNPDGRVPSDATMTVRARHLLRDAGIRKAGACHLFRHTMATQMLEHGADIRYIQEILGHASLATTQIYTHISIGKLKAIHAATHPGAKLQRRPNADSSAPKE